MAPAIHSAPAPTSQNAPHEKNPVAPPSVPAESVVRRIHPGPDGTWLTGFGPLELNQFHYDTAYTVKLPPRDENAIANTKHTTQGVDVEPYTIVTGRQDWVAAEYNGEENYHKWHYHLTDSDIAEIEAALNRLNERNIRLEDINSTDDFPLPTLGPKLTAIRDEIVLGKGFHLIRNFPVNRFSRWQTAAAYYAIGRYFGNQQAQNAKGHMLGHIKAIGTNASKEGVRPYTTNAAHGYHCDNSDLVALLCLQEAEEGGISSWASSIAVHNALLRRGRKDLVEVLTTGHYWLTAHNVWGAPDDKWDASSDHPGGDWVNAPPFVYHENRLLVNYKEGAYYYYYRFPEAPKFTPLQEEALRTFTALAMSDELRLSFKLAPGDIPILNNLTMLHAKSPFKDYADPAKGRHLLRMWMAAPNAPPLPADSYYLATWGSVDIGNRGGYWLGHNYTKKVPLYAEYGDLDANKPEGAIYDPAAAAELVASA